MKYRSQWPTFILRSNGMSYRLIISKYDVHTSNSLQDIRQIQWTMKYRSQWPTNILRSDVRSYWFIIQKYDVQPLNSFHDIRQNHWPWNIGHSVLKIFWGQTSGHTHNPEVWSSYITFQDIRQNDWPTKYRSVTYIYFEVTCRVILTHNPKVWCSYIKVFKI